MYISAYYPYERIDLGKGGEEFFTRISRKLLIHLVYVQ